MRAAVARGREQLAIDERPVPEPGPGEVRLRLRACGICGTDLHFYHAGLWPPGTTPGHEMSGAVDALGPGVEGWQTGDPVAVEPLHSCGVCPSCTIGRGSTSPGTSAGTRTTSGGSPSGPSWAWSSMGRSRRAS